MLRCARPVAVIVISALVSSLTTLALTGHLGPAPAAAQPSTVVAERFVLRGADGVVRAELYVAEPLGDVNLNLNDADGQRLVSMGGVNGTSSIQLMDRAGHARFFVQSGPGLVSHDSGPRIMLFDADDKTIWTAP